MSKFDDLSILIIQYFKMNNYIARSYRDVIVITKFAMTKFAIRRASKACIKTKNILKYINKNNRLTMGQFSKVP